MPVELPHRQLQVIGTDVRGQRPQLIYELSAEAPASIRRIDADLVEFHDKAAIGQGGLGLLLKSDERVAATATVEGAVGVERGTVARSVRSRARELWRSSPYHSLVTALGFSSWEGLAADFLGGHPSLLPLRHWVPSYRVESWTAGLEEFGAAQHALELATWYRSERRESYQLVADTLDVVDAFRRAGSARGRRHERPT